MLQSPNQIDVKLSGEFYSNEIRFKQPRTTRAAEQLNFRGQQARTWKVRTLSGSCGYDMAGEGGSTIMAALAADAD